MSKKKNREQARRYQRSPVHGSRRERINLSEDIIGESEEIVKIDFARIIRLILEALNWVALLMEWSRWNRLARKMIKERQPWAADNAAARAEEIRAELERRKAA